MIKILIGGSPCTFWSIAQSKNRETEAEGLGWELFKNYLVAKEKFKPDFFLYENNKSASQAIKDQIEHELGVKRMEINSALVSAQNRQRFYVFNWDVEQPEDRGILLKDILENGENLTDGDKSYCLTTRCSGAIPEDTIKRGRHTMVAEPVCLRYERTEEGKALRKQYESHEIHHGFNEYRNLQPRSDGKSNTLSTVQKDNLIAEPVAGRVVGRRINEEGHRDDYNLDIECVQRFEVNDNPNKTNCLTTVQKDNMIAQPVRVGTMPSSAGEVKDSQGTRIYATDGKSVGIKANGGGWGAKTGLYAVPSEEKDVCTVKDGMITIKDREYPIKLADGQYKIRKLTVKECCRLQTVPDDFCRAVSDSQAYKGLGNGWTAEVIIHILNGALKDVPKDEEIVVLSMYDGIGTGRYCLDKMGFTNVKYYAYEIDRYAMQVAKSNYPDIIEMGDAFDLRKDEWGLEGRE